MSKKFLYKVEIVYKNVDMFKNITTKVVKNCYILATPEYAYKYLKSIVDKYTLKYSVDIKTDEYNPWDICEYTMRCSSRNLSSSENTSIFYEGICIKEQLFEDIDTF